MVSLKDSSCFLDYYDRLACQTKGILLESLQKRWVAKSEKEREREEEFLRTLRQLHEKKVSSDYARLRDRRLLHDIITRLTDF